MKKKIFISYCQADYEKVKILENKILETEGLEPIIVANNREPLKPLAQKVQDGIIICEFFIPIITQNSINTQWLNQEIGFAISARKKILPIIEESLIDNLKGFIHKQIDIPYLFTTFNHGNLMRKYEPICDILLSDITKTNPAGIELPKISQPNLKDKALEIKNRRDWENKRSLFLDSPEGLDAAMDEVNKLFEIIKNQVDEIAETSGIWIKGDTNTYRLPNLTIKVRGFSIAINWQNIYHGTLDGSYLDVQYWEGVLISDITRLSPQERMNLKPKDHFKYFPDVDKDLKIIWRLDSGEDKIRSEEISYHCINWLLTKSEGEN